jgi:hypothetical protein
MGEYTRADFDALLAKLKRLEPPDMTDCLGLVVGYDEVCAERDALAAELDALKSALPPNLQPGEPVRLILEVDAQNALAIAELCGELLAEKQHLTEDVETLRAELATVKAALPKWRKDKLGLRLGYGTGDFVAAINQQHTGLWSVHTMVVCGRLFPSRDAAMTAVTEALGLPPCEVCE